VLADALATRPSILDTVGSYEREMRSRTRRAVEESEESAQMFHFRNPVAVAFRSTALRGCERGPAGQPQLVRRSRGLSQNLTVFCDKPFGQHAGSARQGVDRYGDAPPDVQESR